MLGSVGDVGDLRCKLSVLTHFYNFIIHPTTQRRQGQRVRSTLCRILEPRFPFLSESGWNDIYYETKCVSRYILFQAKAEERLNLIFRSIYGQIKLFLSHQNS